MEEEATYNISSRILGTAGFVTLLHITGDDEFIVDAARVSNNLHSKDKDVESTRRLVRYLYRNKHTSPFEMVETWWHIKAPLFVARQWMRHRTASVNEVSRRYVDTPPEVYIPPAFPKRAESKKQGRADNDYVKMLPLVRGTEGFSWVEPDEWAEAEAERSLDAYNILLQAGVAPEVARGYLPQNMYTEWYWKIDLHNLFHFMDLRLHAHAQKEIREYVMHMKDLLVLTNQIPFALEIFDEVRVVEEYVRDLMNHKVHKDYMGDLVKDLAGLLNKLE